MKGPKREKKETFDLRGPKPGNPDHRIGLGARAVRADWGREEEAVRIRRWALFCAC
eukprot:NODE_10109_length_346_cov_2.127946_g9199_i0.p5 GENE.NODE_10109_length_346_cov_2.127946_g9199_i0~~NODE_10109_length_346_cov_2.127946_g9199_i0.p5  ORF type:complete len:56 (+),score=5.07 NODE_10109_length_346_cov_2.127946_g9199_i0:73-240(+)